MELSKTKLRRVARFKNFHIRKFLDSRTIILTSRTAKTADSVEGTPCSRRRAEATLEFFFFNFLILFFLLYKRSVILILHQNIGKISCEGLENVMRKKKKIINQ